MHKIRRSCVLFLWMYTLTFVKSQDCTLAQFTGSKLFDLNFDTSDLEASYPPGKQVRVSCNVGYTGFFKLICTEGNWQSIGTKCEAKSCGHPGDAQFADFHLEKGDDFVFGSQVVYNCHKGYQMVSRRNYRTCMAAGWDGVVPVCEALQCPVIHINDTIQVTGDPEEATYGNVLRFSCKSSTEILYGPAEIYCDENGMWSDNPPRCEAVKCKVPEIEHGTVTGDITDYNEHQILYFECNARYGKSEERPSKCTKMGQRADWSPTPACEPIKCKLQLSQLEGTRYDPPHRNVFSPGETLRVTCEARYWIFNPQDSSTVVTCRDDGQWTSDPTCKEVTCSRPYDQHIYYWDNYWQRKKTLGDTVRYSCTSGYKSTNGATRATCTRDGWTPDPLCQEITCDRREIPNAAIDNMKEKYKYSEWANYVCNEGYRGRFTLTCTERGWEGNPQCTEITCDPPRYRNADIVNYKTIYRYKEQAVYECRDGNRGGFTLTCTEQGWIGRTQCTEITCDPPTYDDLDIVNPKKKYKFKERAEYKCKDADKEHFFLTCGEDGWGKKPQCTTTEITCDPPTYDDLDIVNPKKKYKFKERAEYKCKDADKEHFFLTCGEDGWGKKPQCTTTECQKPEFANGFIVGPDENKMYYYTCNEGYKLLTKGWWSAAKCNDSVWSELHQCIANTSCSLPDVPNGEVTPKQNSYEQDANVLIICKQGYRSEVAELTCREGKWPELQQICTPMTNTCPPPPKVKNAVVVTSYQKEYLHDSEVTYQCRQSYTIEGNNKITCKNGEWQNVDITCTNVTYVAADKPTDTNMRPALTVVSCEPPPDGLTIENLPEDQEHTLPEHRIEISCPQGTRLNGSSQLTCGENGQWDNPFPTCEKECIVTSVSSGVAITQHQQGDKLSIGQKLEFTCKKSNKVIEGKATVECLENGQWSDPFPTCGPPGCGKPPQVEGGVIIGTVEATYRSGDKVEYTCEANSNLSFKKTCKNGVWTGNTRCMCQKLPNVPHASITEQSKKVQYGLRDVIHFVCETGYVSGLTIKFECKDEGWVVARPGECRLKPCELPDDIPNGYYQIIHGEDFVFGATIKYFCNEGYQMISRADTRICSLNKWTNHVPVCEPLSCDPPPEELIIKDLQEDRGPVLPDRFIEISCPPGKRLNGSSVLTCGKNGQWNYPFPTCEVVTCEPPPEGLIVKGLPEDHGPILPERLIQISCPPDKTLNGSSGLSCGQDGQWNGPFPTCEDKCRFTGVAQGVVFTPRSARGHMFNRGQKLQFGCRMYGHFLHGNAEVVCSGNGQWSDPFPTCGPPSGCGKPPPLADGDTRFTSKFKYNHNDRVEYTCKNYYTMRGGPSKICNNGDWTGNITCLRPCTVDKEIMLKHNIAFLYSWEEKLYSPHETFLSFRCTGRTRHVGTVSMRQQCIDGVISLPTCQ
ncbi:complement factor H-like isoform X2 [Channa argus]|uniref:complement factor H-like isoform X2 n=1 Tax=Channa argus TaxID=215402 RepID=UPI00352003B9